MATSAQIKVVIILYMVTVHKMNTCIGLGDMAKKMITICFFISVDIDNYYDKCQIFISFKFKARFFSKVKVVETRPFIFLNKINI